MQHQTQYFRTVPVSEKPKKEWRRVMEWEEYEVSDAGDVFRNGRILKQRTNRKGYLVVTLSDRKRRKLATVHRLVAIAFIPNVENKPEVNHKDGNKLNNNKGNLEWATNRENIGHAVKNDLMARVVGERNGNSKLTELQVIEVLQSTERTFLLAKKFNVDSTAIKLIRNGTNWKHLQHHKRPLPPQPINK